ncbi:hypothetical protein [Arthrobacter sp. SW1]|uniref:Cap15 family cyclic dinucleotide receptor domain-containing protein n=1 Tax=Arthrobacter sp. SW1 TaxID=1920889 RepID=UPI0011131C2E|nr:hypothetical protein [Arthrobacter sp. SW1]
MRVKIAAYIAFALISLVNLINGLQLPTLWSRAVSAIPLLVVGAFAAFDKWVWRWWLIPRVTQRPVLHGTWHGHLVSTWAPESQQSTNNRYEAFLVVTQSFTSIQIVLITEQSKSRSVIADIVRNSADDFSVFYHYGNTPRVEVRDGSPIHMGGTSFEVFDVNPQNFEGEYWTSRKSGGSMTFQRISNKRIGNFADGKKLMEENAND